MEKHGIVNGARGTIQAIIYLTTKAETTLPDAIVVHFPDYDRPQFFNNSDRNNWIPINAISGFCTTTKNSRVIYQIFI